MTDHAPYQGSAFAPPPSYAGPARPLRVPAAVAVVGLALTVVSALLGAGLLAYLYLAVTGAGSVDSGEAVVAFLDGPHVGIGVTLLLGTGIAFVVWLHRARTNVDSPDEWDLRWKPGWSIGGWFVPLANFVIPLLVVSEIDRVSERRANEAEGRPTVRRGWAVALWGTLWTVFLLQDRFATALYENLEGSTSTLVLIAASVLEAAAAASALLLVLRVTANQERFMARPAFPSALPEYAAPTYPAGGDIVPPVTGAEFPPMDPAPPSAK